MASLFKRIGRAIRWTKIRKPVAAAAAVTGAVAGIAATGGLGLAALGATGGASSGMGAALGAAGLAASAVGTATGIVAQRKAEHDAKKAAEQAEALAGAGAVAPTAEAEVTADTTGNEAYKKKQAALAGGYARGRAGTSSAQSNLGGRSSLG